MRHKGQRSCFPSKRQQGRTVADGTRVSSTSGFLTYMIFFQNQQQQATGREMALKRHMGRRVGPRAKLLVPPKRQAGRSGGKGQRVSWYCAVKGALPYNNASYYRRTMPNLPQLWSYKRSRAILDTNKTSNSETKSTMRSVEVEFVWATCFTQYNPKKIKCRQLPACHHFLSTYKRVSDAQKYYIL